jgi:2-haloacid dehalogenase
VPRWATFDCYGTLVDWNGGIRAVLERTFGRGRGDALLARYHEVEPELQSGDGFRSYREVLTLALEQLALEQGVDLARPAALAESLPSWRAFPDVKPALEELRDRGWRLAILSNTDRDLIEASQRQIGVQFDRVLTAQDVGSYKPAHGHWNAFFEQSGATRDGHVHVGASLFHDGRPARELGLRFVWINRLREEGDLELDGELPDLRALPDTLDELVPA